MTDTGRIPPVWDDQSKAAVHVRASIRMQIPTRKRKEARGILASMIGRIRLEEGCLSCRLYQDTMGSKAFLFEEIWAAEDSFKHHLRSDEFRNVLLVVEMASEPPEIRFDRITHSEGIDAIGDLRERADGLPGVNGLPV